MPIDDGGLSSHDLLREAREAMGLAGDARRVRMDPEAATQSSVMSAFDGVTSADLIASAPSLLERPSTASFTAPPVDYTQIAVPEIDSMEDTQAFSAALQPPPLQPPPPTRQPPPPRQHQPPPRRRQPPPPRARPVVREPLQTPAHDRSQRQTVQQRQPRQRSFPRVPFRVIAIVVGALWVFGSNAYESLTQDDQPGIEASAAFVTGDCFRGEPGGSDFAPQSCLSFHNRQIIGQAVTSCSTIFDQFVADYDFKVQLPLVEIPADAELLQFAIPANDGGTDKLCVISSQSWELRGPLAG